MVRRMTASRSRLPGIDVLRGVAVVAMILYHFAWDLRFFGLIETDVVGHPLWRAFAMGIAGTFLTLSGISLALLARDGLDRARFLRRLALIAGAASLVTAATWIAMPESFIFFGILHSIALGSVLALPFLRAPIAVALAVAAAVFVLPFAFQHPAFDAPLLRWVGLGTRAPLTNDFVPSFPWFALVLVGVAIGRTIIERPPAWLAAASRAFAERLGVLGRWSLPIYLVHQPLLLALVYVASLGLAPSGPDRDTLEFRNACARTCGASADAAFCARYCACAEGEIRQAELWTPLLRNALTARQQSQLAATTESCQVKAR